MNGIISIVRTNNSHHAEVAELADALDSKSSAYKRAGSSPAFGTTKSRAPFRVLLFFCEKSLFRLKTKAGGIVSILYLKQQNIVPGIENEDCL